MTTKLKKKKVMYFEEGCDEHCYPLESHIETLKFSDLDELTLNEAVRDIGGDGMWCMMEGEVIYRGEGNCGKFNCRNYKPRNWKSGICEQMTWCFKPTGRQFKLTKNGLEAL